mgnify:CR=1 FL=1|tara:strand:+ start:61 stop:1236 length:1176 start_codon:yes stop_codon:yes gene_type:complete
MSITDRKPNDFEQLTEVSAAEVRGNSTRKALEFNTYGNSSEFQVKVLTTPISMDNEDIAAMFGNSDTGEASNGKRIKSFSFMGRIINVRERPSPHLGVDDPSMESPGPRRDLLIKAFHTHFVSSNEWQGTRPKVGDTVKVNLTPGDFSFNLQISYFDSITISAEGTDEDYDQVPSSAAAFNQNNAGPLEQVINIKTPEVSSGSNEFIQRLRDSGHFPEFSDQFLAGLAANAQAESDLGKAKYDKALGWVVGDKLTSKHSQKAANRAIKGWCSHGLWQMNVCPGNAEGNIFARDRGIDLTTNEGKNKFVKDVNDDTVLFSWIAMRMRAIPKIEKHIQDTGPNAAFNAGKAITKHFEKPAGCGDGQKCGKSDTRGALAQRMYESYADYKVNPQ